MLFRYVFDFVRDLFVLAGCSISVFVFLFFENLCFSSFCLLWSCLCLRVRVLRVDVATWISHVWLIRVTSCLGCVILRVEFISV